MQDSSSQLFVRFRRSPSPRVRLLCFPFAGGSPGFFRAWQDQVGADVEVAALQLPGRGARFQEAPIARMEPLVDAIVPSVEAMSDRPFVFFGHSMGARVAFEVARRLRRRGSAMPAHLFVSGCVAPDRPMRARGWHTLSDEALIAELRRLGGTPDEALRNRELMQLMLPLVRADFAVLETHRFEPQTPLGVSIDALGGLMDPAVTAADLDAWGAFTSRAFARRSYAGGHFFLQPSRDIVLSDVRARLAAIHVDLRRRAS